MTETAAALAKRLRHSYRAAGQEHVFRFFDLLTGPTRDRFLAQLAAVDLPLLQRLVGEMRRDEPIATLDLERLEPPPILPLPTTPAARRQENRAIRAGQELLAAGKTAVFVVAGGQGTRLGYDGPKGFFPIGPVSGCSLFEWHFAKLLVLRRRFQARIPFLVMTSEANHDETCSFLADRGYFGLPEEDVLVFRQGMLPAVDREGRLLLGSKGSLFLSPDGHGGSLSALAREGVLDELEARGIEEIFYFQVDNPLVKILDSAFLGHHRLTGSQMSSKVVPKRNAAEKVGVFARAGASLGIVEYSDLPAALAEARDAAGELLYGAGNIAIHVIAVEFVRQLTDGGLQLPFHRAAKPVPHIDADGELVTPDTRNGIKFETFVFDAIPAARNPLVVETSRAEEFSPVKNAAGEDSAATARRDLIALFRRWLEAAGFSVGEEAAVLEISPLFALDREDLVTRLKKERLICRGGLLLS